MYVVKNIPWSVIRMVHTPFGSSPQHLTVLKVQSWKPASDLHRNIQSQHAEFDEMFMYMRHVKMTGEMDICIIKNVE